MQKNTYFIFGSVRLVEFFFVILGRRFVDQKRCRKRPIATPTIRLPVEVDLGWALRDVIEGTIANCRACVHYIMYGERLPCGSLICRLGS